MVGEKQYVKKSSMSELPEATGEGFGNDSEIMQLTLVGHVKDNYKCLD